MVRLGCADMAQMVERVLGKDEVTGSIPVISSNKTLQMQCFLFFNVGDLGLTKDLTIGLPKSIEKLFGKRKNFDARKDLQRFLNIDKYNK